jgi:UDP-glucose 4-epimerase
MKRILVTGAGRYIGTSFENYILNNFSEDFTVDTVDMLDSSWREKDFSKYDSIFHVAGIAHSDSGKINEEKSKLYYSVNTDLAIETARKAKGDGVGQFIYMSSAIVYGDSAPIGKTKFITFDTEPSPSNSYGDSKLKAEKALLLLNDEKFRVVILRPPMIYGRGSRGNYPVLSKMAVKLPMFPKVHNCRSMLYVENLCEFVRLMVKNFESGIFYPQNSEYSNTSELVRMIAGVHGKKINLVGGLSWVLKLLSHFTGLVNKAFGNLSYDMKMSEYRENYTKVSLLESIEKTEKTID